MRSCGERAGRTGIERRLERHDEQPDDDDEEDVPAGEAHPGEGVGREGRDDDRDDRRRDRDEQAVDERIAEVRLVEDVA